MKLKRSATIPLILLIYLIIMSVIAYPDYASGRNTPLYYFGVIITTLAVIVALHFALRRRERLRKEREEDMRK